MDIVVISFVDSVPSEKEKEDMSDYTLVREIVETAGAQRPTWARELRSIATSMRGIKLPLWQQMRYLPLMGWLQGTMCISPIWGSMVHTSLDRESLARYEQLASTIGRNLLSLRIAVGSNEVLVNPEPQPVDLPTPVSFLRVTPAQAGGILLTGDRCFEEALIVSAAGCPAAILGYDTGIRRGLCLLRCGYRELLAGLVDAGVDALLHSGAPIDGIRGLITPGDRSLPIYEETYMQFVGYCASLDVFAPNTNFTLNPDKRDTLNPMCIDCVGLTKWLLARRGVYGVDASNINTYDLASQGLFYSNGREQGSGNRNVITASMSHW